MAGAIILRNGYGWYPSGVAFRALVSEVAARLDPVRDREVLRIINDPSGPVDLLDFIDLSARDQWSESVAERVEAALKETYYSIAHHDDWRVLTERDALRDHIFRRLARLVEIGLERNGIARHTVDDDLQPDFQGAQDTGDADPPNL